MRAVLLAAAMVVVGCGKKADVAVVPAPTPVEPKDTKDELSPLPNTVLKAWKNAGADLGSMKPDDNGFLRFFPGQLPDAVPAFWFGEWKAGLLERLPPPEGSFGLVPCGGTSQQRAQVTDAALKEIGRFVNLTAIDLSATQVTDAGLRELARLKQLTALNLAFAEVTDAGLKELSGFTKLVFLNLSGTEVTNSGVAELQKALPNCKISR